MVDTRTAGDVGPDDAGKARTGGGQAAEGAALMAAVRRGDDEAIEGLYERYLPLLVTAARRHRVLPSDREELALEVIAEVAMQLMREGAPVPRSLPGLLMAVLRRRVVDRLRREAARIPELSLDAAPDETLAITDDGSERARAGPGLVRLADHLESYVDDTELQILYWLAEHVPQRTIAEWLGMGHGAMRMRIARLRDRLREVVRTYWNVADDDSRAELARFFHRYLNPVTTLPPSRGPGRAPRGRRHGSST